MGRRSGRGPSRGERAFKELTLGFRGREADGQVAGGRGEGTGKDSRGNLAGSTACGGRTAQRMVGAEARGLCAPLSWGFVQRTVHAFSFLYVKKHIRHQLGLPLWGQIPRPRIRSI